VPWPRAGERCSWKSWRRTAPIGDLRRQVRNVGRYVDKILRRTKPGDIPVEQPTKYELVINLKTAKSLGLTIPQSLIQRADQVIHP